MSILSLRSYKKINDFSFQLKKYLSNQGIDHYLIHPADFDEDKLLTSLSHDFIKQYFDSGYDKQDLILDHVRNLDKVAEPCIFRHQIYDACKFSPLYIEKSKVNCDIMDCFRQYGYLDAYYIPIATNLGTNFSVAIFSKDKEREEFKEEIEQRKDFIQLLFEVVVEICCSNFPKLFFGAKNNFSGVANVTNKQAELLSYIAKEDLQLGQAADRMCISLDTANKHIAAAKQALGCNTQAGCVYWGIKKGIIDLTETITPKERRQGEPESEKKLKLQANQERQMPRPITVAERVVKLRQEV